MLRAVLAPQGSSLYLLATAAGLALALLCGLQLMPTLCKALRLGFCATDAGAALLELAPAAAANFRWLAGILAIVLLTLLVAGRLTLRVVPTFTKRDKTRLGEFKAYVRKVAELEKSLYAEYFSSIRSIET